MKKISFRLLSFSPAALIVAGAFSIAPNEAHAIKCSLTYSCEETTRAESAQVQSRISAMQDAVTAAVNRANRDIVNAIAGSTKTVSDSVTNGSDANSENAADIEKRKEKREQAERRPRMTCGNSGASQGPRGGGSGGSSQASGPNGTYRPGNVAQRWKKAMTESEQVAGQVAPPPEISAEHKADIGVGGCQSFADERSLRGFICRSIANIGSGMSKYKDADVKAASLFDGPQASDSKGKNLSIPSNSSAERDARAAYLKMLNNASPLPTPTKSAMANPNAMAYLGLRSEYDAAKSLASYPSLEFDRLTTIDPQTKGALDQIKKDDSDYVSKYLSTLPSNAIQGGAISPLMLMDIEVERRIGNEEWLKRMVAGDEILRAQEQLFIDAYSLRLQRDQILAQHQTNVLLGKILDLTVEQGYRPGLESMAETMQLSADENVE